MCCESSYPDTYIYAGGPRRAAIVLRDWEGVAHSALSSYHACGLLWSGRTWWYVFGPDLTSMTLEQRHSAWGPRNTLPVLSVCTASVYARHTLSYISKEGWLRMGRLLWRSLHKSWPSGDVGKRCVDRGLVSVGRPIRHFGRSENARLTHFETGTHTHTRTHVNTDTHEEVWHV